MEAGISEKSVYLIMFSTLYYTHSCEKASIKMEIDYIRPLYKTACYWTFMIAFVLAGCIFGESDHFAKCGERETHGFLLCHCDALCELYQDCCHGYSHNSSGSLGDTTVKLVSKSTCEPIRGLDFDVSMVKKLDSKLARWQKFASICRFPNQSVPMETLPVYIANLGATFKSIYCATPYVAIPREYVQFWTLQISSKCFQKSLMNVRMKRYTDLLSKLMTQTHCLPVLIPPDGSSTRLCFKQSLSGCYGDNDCNCYQSPVVNSAGEVFKNQLCAAQSNNHASTTSLSSWTTEQADYKQTILTLYQIDPMLWPFEDPCENTGECNQNCKSGELAFYDRCIEPISKVRGYLHQIEFQLDSYNTIITDNSLFSDVISPYIDEGALFYVTGSVMTFEGRQNVSSCRHLVQILMYLRHDVDYHQFINLSSTLKHSLDVNRENIKTDIQNKAINSNRLCTIGKVRSGSSRSVQWDMPIFEDIRLIIFVSIISAFLLGVVGVTLAKVLRRAIIRQRTIGSNSIEVPGRNASIAYSSGDQGVVWH